MTMEQIIIVVLAVLLAAVLIACIVLGVKYKKSEQKRREGNDYAEEVVVKDGVRYSADPAMQKGGSVKISHAQGDFVLAVNKTYRAEQDGELLPGTYTLLAASDATHAFKLRVGGLVRSFRHGDQIVLKDGEELCAVSCSVILR